MNTAIMQWSSTHMYESRLCAHASVANHSVQDLSECADLQPLLFIDTAGCLMHEAVEESASGISESKSNVGEADLVLQIIQELTSKGIKEDTIGVISPYSA